MNTIRALRTNLFQEKDLNVIQISKESAVALIKDLAQSLSDTGIDRLVFRDSNNKFFTFTIKE